jgi:hypothetical protein
MGKILQRKKIIALQTAIDPAKLLAISKLRLCGYVTRFLHWSSKEFNFPICKFPR